MRKILIATDFSPQSREAIRNVLALLNNVPGPCYIDLLNTFVVLQEDPAMALQLNDTLKERSRQELQRNIQEAQQLSSNPSITFNPISRMGSLKNVISQLIRGEKYDLVVMGKDGGRHVEEISQMLQKTGGCPLLVTFKAAA